MSWWWRWWWWDDDDGLLTDYHVPDTVLALNMHALLSPVFSFPTYRWGRGFSLSNLPKSTKRCSWGVNLGWRDPSAELNLQTHPWGIVSLCPDARARPSSSFGWHHSPMEWLHPAPGFLTYQLMHSYHFLISCFPYHISFTRDHKLLRVLHTLPWKLSLSPEFSFT